MLGSLQQSTGQGGDFSRTQSGHTRCVEREGVARSKGCPHPHDIHRTQKGTNGGKKEQGWEEGRQKKSNWPGQKVCANEQQQKKVMKNHYTNLLSSFTKLGPSYINSNKSKPEGQIKNVRASSFQWEM